MAVGNKAWHFIPHGQNIKDYLQIFTFLKQVPRKKFSMMGALAIPDTGGLFKRQNQQTLIAEKTRLGPVRLPNGMKTDSGWARMPQ